MLRHALLILTCAGFAYGEPNWDGTLISECITTPVTQPAKAFADGYFTGEGHWLTANSDNGNIVVEEKGGTVDVVWNAKLLWTWDIKAKWNYVGISVAEANGVTTVRLWQNEDSKFFREVRIDAPIHPKTWTWGAGYFQPRTADAYLQPGP